MGTGELPYTSEEEMIADHFARTSRLVTECAAHPGSFYRTYSRFETIEEIDRSLQINGDRSLALIKRNALQKKALVVIIMRKYPDRCPQCGLH